MLKSVSGRQERLAGYDRRTGLTFAGSEDRARSPGPRKQVGSHKLEKARKQIGATTACNIVDTVKNNEFISLRDRDSES